MNKIEAIRAAEDFAFRLSATRVEIRELEEERKGLSGSAKAKLTRRINRLVDFVKEYEEDLAHLPAAPIEPSKVMERIRHEVERAQKSYGKAKEKFLLEASGSPTWAIEWGERIVKEEYEYQQLLPVKTSLDAGGSVWDIYEIAKKVLKARTDEHMNRFYMPSSTCKFHNAVESVQLQARAEMIRERYQTWHPVLLVIHAVEDSREGLENWEVLYGTECDVATG